MDEPRPLTESDDALAHLVRGARTLHVEYDVSAAVVRHERLVAAGVPPLLPTSGRVLRWAWIGCTIAVVGGAALFAARGRVDAAASEPSTSIASTIELEPPTPAREPAAIVAAPEVAERRQRAERAVQEPAHAPPRPRAPSGATQRVGAADRPDAHPSPAPTDDDDRIAREAAQVRRIRELLDAGDAEAAVAACDEGDREFARGVFALERDGLRTLAALALDRPSARDDAEAYLDRYPRAPLARKIRDALAQAREG